MLEKSFAKIILFFKTLVIIFLLAKFSFAQATARPEVLFVPENEYSHKSKIFMADIVTVKNGNHELIKALATFPLLEIKNASQKIEKLEAASFPESRLTSQELSIKLKNFINSNEVIKSMNPLFRIPSMIHFFPVKEGNIARSEIQNRVSQALTLDCPQCEFEVQIKNTVKLTSLNWEIDYSSVGIKPAMVLSISEASYRSFRALSIGLKVRHIMPVAKRNIGYGERLAESDFEMTSHELRSLGDRILSFNDVWDSKAAKSLVAGEALVQSFIKKEPLAKKGSLVKAVIGNDVFQINTTFMAEEDGFRGDVIKIKHPENGKILSASVVDKDLVKVKE